MLTLLFSVNKSVMLWTINIIITFSFWSRLFLFLDDLTLFAYCFQNSCNRCQLLMPVWRGVSFSSSFQHRLVWYTLLFIACMSHKGLWHRLLSAYCLRFKLLILFHLCIFYYYLNFNIRNIFFGYIYFYCPRIDF